MLSPAPAPVPDAPMVASTDVMIDAVPTVGIVAFTGPKLVAETPEDPMTFAAREGLTRHVVLSSKPEKARSVLFCMSLIPTEYEWVLEELLPLSRAAAPANYACRLSKIARHFVSQAATVTGRRSSEKRFIGTSYSGITR